MSIDIFTLMHYNLINYTGYQRKIMNSKKEKSITLKHIAAVANVSRVTVGKVLLGSGGDRIRVSEEVAAKIRRIGAENNYRPNVPAQMLAGKKNRTIGILMDSMCPLSTIEKVSLVEKYLNDYGYMILIGQGHNNPQKLIDYVDEFKSRGVDGFISFAHNYPGNKWLPEEYLRKIKNIVFVQKPEGEGNFANVTVDIAAGFRKLVAHLHQRGRRRIGLVVTNTSHPNVQSSRKGYFAGLEQYALPQAEELVFATPELPGNLKTFCQEAVNALLTRQKVDAIMAGDDIIAYQMIKELKSQNVRIPEQVAISGFDNLMFSEYCEPGLTSVDHCNNLVAKNSIELLLSLLDNDDKEMKALEFIVDPELVIRKST